MSAKAYTVAASYYHWLVAAPLMASIASVLKCQQSPKEEKGKWMFRHKSMGLLTGLVVAPRLGYRIFNAAKYQVGHPVGTGPVEGKLADISHAALYAFMTIMPATGIAMGYYGGKGLPFFWTTLPGAAEKNGSIAGTSFKIHKQLGTYGKFLVPLHIGGAVKHSVSAPPFGPRTSLNRPGYGTAGDVRPRWVVAISKMPPTRVIAGFVSVFTCLAYLPLMGQKLPYTLSPEYLAAQRAYMRYHNMNPIWGISKSDDH